MIKHDLRIFADYFQINVEDSSIIGQHEAEWNDEEMQERLVITEESLLISTARNMTVPFTLEYYDSKPNVILPTCDHVVECSISSSSGKLFVSGPTDFEDDVFKIELPAGLYGALACYKGLGTISADGLKGNDSYHLYLWKEDHHLPKKVLKQWTDH